MAQTIKLKRSATSGATPTTSQLELGEVAINTYDGKMYIKKDVGGTESIVEIGGLSSVALGGLSDVTISSAAADQLLQYNGSQWVNVSIAEASAIMKEYQFTATAGQSTFTGSDDNSETLSYTAGAIQVFLNGIFLDSAVDYTATNGTSIVLSETVDANDYLQVVAFKKKIGDGNVSVNTFTGDDSTTAFTLSLDPGDENNTRVFIDGVYQSKSNYSVSGTTLTFSTAPPTGTAVEVEIGNRVVTLDTLSDLDLPDDVKLRLGTDQDLQIYHDGSNSYIDEQGTGSLNIRSSTTLRLQNASGTNYLYGTNAGEVVLYHNGSPKLYTTSTGIDVAGSVAINSSTTSASTTNQLTLRGGTGNVVSGHVVGGINFDSFDLGNQNTSASISAIASGSHVSGSTLDTDLNFKTADGSSPVSRLNIAANGDISFYEDTGTTAKLTWDASAESLNFADNGKAVFGAGSDLQIYHDGSNSIITESGAGSLILRGTNTYIQDSSSVNMIQALSGGAVTLNYNSAPKLATTSTGIDVTGTISSGEITVGPTSGGSGSLIRATGAFSGDAIGSPSNVPLVLQATGSDTTFLGALNQYGRQVFAVNISGSADSNTQRGVIDFYTKTNGSFQKALTLSQDDVIVRGDLTVDGTISSGAITSTGASAFTDLAVGGAADSNYDLKVYGLARFQGVSNFVSASTPIQVGGTTIIDSSRNLTNIGTIASGAIHVTGASNDTIDETNFNAKIQGSGGNGIIVGTIASSPYYSYIQSGYVVDTSLAQYPLVLNPIGGSVGVGGSETNPKSFATAFGVHGSTSSGLYLHDDNAGRYGYLEYDGNNFNISAQHSAGVLNLKTNDQTRISIDASGSVGIGTTAPSAALHVDSSNDGPIFDSGGTGNTNHALLVRDSANNQLLRVNNNGNVGIGTSSPDQALSVVGKMSFKTGATTRGLVGSPSWEGSYVSVQNGTLAESAANSALNQSSGGVTAVNAASGQRIEFKIANSERMRIDSSGNVGIGTSSIDLTASGRSVVQVEGSSNALLNLTDGTSRLYLHQKGGTSGADIWNSANSYMRFATNDTEAMRIDSSGNLLVGKTSASKDTVGAELKADGRINATMSSGSPLLANRKTSDGDIATFQKDGTTVGSIGCNGAAIHLASGTTGIRVISDNTIRPSDASGALKDNAIDLGASNARWKDLYLSGTVNAGGGTVVSSGSNAFSSKAVGGYAIQAYQDATSANHTALDLRSDSTISTRFLIRGYNNAAVTPAEVFSVGADGSAFFNSNVGIGTTSPSRRLHVQSSGSVPCALFGNSAHNNSIELTRITSAPAYLALQAYSSTGGLVGGPALTFSTANSGGGSATERMRINSSGNVGIGTSGPSAKLHLATTGSEEIGIGLQNSQRYYGIQTTGGALTVKDVSAGGTERMRIDASGRITMPYQPAFRASGNGSWQAIGSNVQAPFNVAVVNIGGHYSATNRRFTAPVAGQYYFTWHTYNDNAYSNAIVPRVNGSGLTGGGGDAIVAYQNSGVTGNLTISASIVLTLAANDYVDIACRVNHSSRIYMPHSQFSGYLIG